MRSCLLVLSHESACDAQKKHNYEGLKGLHKQIFRVPVGIGGCGYSLLHDFVTRQSDLSLQALSAIYETIMPLLFSRSTHRNLETNFYEATEKPGLRAAAYAQLVCDATSIAVTYLMHYREDGESRNLITGTVGFISLESW